MQTLNERDKELGNQYSGWPFQKETLVDAFCDHREEIQLECAEKAVAWLMSITYPEELAINPTLMRLRIDQVIALRAAILDSKETSEPSEPVMDDGRTLNQFVKDESAQGEGETPEAVVLRVSSMNSEAYADQGDWVGAINAEMDHYAALLAARQSESAELKVSDLSSEAEMFNAAELCRLGVRAEKAEAEAKALREALQVISDTPPGSTMLNLNARTSDPDAIKFANNHQCVARAALVKE